MMKNTKLENWDVQSSSLSVDGLQCHVTAALIPEQHSSIFQIATMRIEKQIVLPSNQWKMTFMPGQAERVPITYLNQSNLRLFADGFRCALILVLQFVAIIRGWPV